MADHFIVAPALVRPPAGSEVGRIVLRNVAGDPWSSGALTVEFWVRAGVLEGTDPGLDPIVKIWCGDRALEIGRHPYAYVRLGPGGDPGPISLEPMPPDAWRHVAVVVARDAETRLHLGPSATGSATTGPALLLPGKTPELIEICPSPAASSGACGAIGDLRLWCVARAAKEIERDRNRRLVGNEPGLVGYWLLDEGDDDRIHDLTLNGNDGSLSEAVWEDYSGLTISLGDVVARIEHFRSKTTKMEEDLRRLEAEAVELERGLQDARSMLAARIEEAHRVEEANARRIAEARRKLDECRARDQSERAELLAQKADSGRLSWGGLISQVEQDVGDAVAASDDDGRSYRLDNVSVDLKVVPGIGGEGLHLPDLTQRVDPESLSTLTIRLRRRPAEPARKQILVPDVRGYTEAFARRKLAEAGFRVATAYRTVDVSDAEMGRVLVQVPDPGTAEAPTAREPNSEVQLIVGAMPDRLGS